MHVRWNCMHVIKLKFAEDRMHTEVVVLVSSPLLTCSHGIVAENDLSPYAFSPHSSL